MLIPHVNIFIEQVQKLRLPYPGEQPSQGYYKPFIADNRFMKFKLSDACISCEVEFNTDQITQTGKVTISRKFLDKISKTIKANATNSDDFTFNAIGNLIERGDRIKITTGYEWLDKGQIYNVDKLIFTGFVSKINYSNIVELSIEDFSFVLKNTSIARYKKYFPTEETFKNGEYDTTKKGNSLEDMINIIFQNSTWNGMPLSYFSKVRVDNSRVGVGKWVINYEASIFQFLEELRSKYKLQIFCVPDVIISPEGGTIFDLNNQEMPGKLKIYDETFVFHLGITQYYERNKSFLHVFQNGKYKDMETSAYGIKHGDKWIAQNTKIFDIQGNVINNDLIFKDKNEFNIKLIAYGAVKEVSGERTKKGVLKKKQLRVLPTKDENGNDFIGSVGGDVRTNFFFPPVDSGTTNSAQTNMDYPDLKRYYINTTTHEEIQFPENVIPTGWNESTQGRIVLRSQILREQAQQQYHKLNASNLSGTITIFGMPFIEHGDIVEIMDIYNNEPTNINGRQFLVKGVKSSWGTSEGLRQDISLDYSYQSLSDEEKTKLNSGLY